VRRRPTRLACAVASSAPSRLEQLLHHRLAPARLHHHHHCAPAAHCHQYLHVLPLLPRPSCPKYRFPNSARRRATSIPFNVTTSRPIPNVSPRFRSRSPVSGKCPSPRLVSSRNVSHNVSCQDLNAMLAFFGSNLPFRSCVVVRVSLFFCDAMRGRVLTTMQLRRLTPYADFRSSTARKPHISNPRRSPVGLITKPNAPLAPTSHLMSLPISRCAYSCSTRVRSLVLALVLVPLSSPFVRSQGASSLRLGDRRGHCTPHPHQHPTHSSHPFPRSRRVCVVRFSRSSDIHLGLWFVRTSLLDVNTPDSRCLKIEPAYTRSRCCLFSYRCTSSFFLLVELVVVRSG